MRYFSAVLAIGQKLPKSRIRIGGDLGERRHHRIAGSVKRVGEFGIFRCTGCGNDVVPRGSFRGRCLRIKIRNVEILQISGDVADAAVCIPAPEPRTNNP